MAESSDEDNTGGAGGDGGIALRPDTLAALQEVLRERAAAAERAAGDASDGRVALATSEDWELSQFWYDEETASALAAEVLALAGAAHAAAGGSRPVHVAFLACPSTFKAVRAAAPPPHVVPHLLEFDPRFQVFGDAFARYDFNEPLALPRELCGAVDVLCLDPPFLNADCLRGFAASARALARDPTTCPLLLCTGAVMLPHARALLGARPTRFHVGHAAGRLSNPFALFVNYDDAGRLGSVDDDAERAAAAEEAGGGGGGGGGGDAVPDR